MKFSVVIPAHNEGQYILQTIEGIIESAKYYCVKQGCILENTIEVILVLDQCSDDTSMLVTSVFGQVVQQLKVHEGAAGRSRNRGVSVSKGSTYLFVDADTIVPKTIFEEIDCFLDQGKVAGLFSLVSKEPGFLPKLWWIYWGMLRQLPMAKAKAMSGCSFCTKEHFMTCGGFNDQVEFAEEWKVFSAAFLKNPDTLVTRTKIKARTSSRRILSVRAAFILFCKWSGAVLIPALRKKYTKATSKILQNNFSKIKPEKNGFLIRALAATTNTKINSLSVTEDSLKKTRRWYSSFLVGGYNMLFTSFVEPLRMLRFEQWKNREQFYFKAMYGKPIPLTTKGRGLIFPLFQGQALHSILSDPGVSDEKKLSAVNLAIHALNTFHLASEGRFYAHGDAHVKNVIINFDTNMACWFDFETILDEGLLRSEQIAYDLIVFILSVCEYWPKAPIFKVMECVFVHNLYNDLLVIGSVNHTLERFLTAPTLLERCRFFHVWNRIGEVRMAVQGCSVRN